MYLHNSLEATVLIILSYFKMILLKSHLLYMQNEHSSWSSQSHIHNLIHLVSVTDPLFSLFFSTQIKRIVTEWECKGAVLANQGYYYKTPWTTSKWIKNRHLFFIDLETRIQGLGARQIWFHFRTHRWLSFQCVLTWRGEIERGALVSFFSSKETQSWKPHP